MYQVRGTLRKISSAYCWKVDSEVSPDGYGGYEGKIGVAEYIVEGVGEDGDEGSDTMGVAGGSDGEGSAGGVGED